MKHVSGTECARPFVPAKDFQLSRQFYLDLGFNLLLDSEVAIFGIGSTSFLPELLQEGLGRELHDAIDGRRP